MPLIHQENCEFPSIHFPMLESSINNSGEKADEHNTVSEDRKLRGRPFSYSTMNQASPSNTPLRNRNSKRANNIDIVHPVNKRPLRTTKLPRKYYSPEPRPAKRFGLITKNASKFNVDCQPSTSQIVLKTVNEKPKELPTQSIKSSINLNETFQQSRPPVPDNIDEEHKNMDSVPPFAKQEILIESDDEGDNTNAKKRKHNNNEFAISGELFDLAPVRAMRVGFQFPAEKEKFSLENTTKWFVRWNGAIQIENKYQKSPKGPTLYKSPFSKAFGKMTVQRKFKLPSQRISYSNTEDNSNVLHLNHVSSFAYKLDEIDVSWLDKENWKRMTQGYLPINIEEFNHIIDKLEVCCYSALSRMSLEQIYSSRRFFDKPKHAACDICYVADCDPEDNIIFCEACETAVHQCCYGLEKLPTGSWICDVCITESKSASCLLCPLPKGAMKKISKSSFFVHIACALWIPEVTFENAARRETIDVSKIKNNRLAAVCEVCGVVNGACLFCDEKDCHVAYHVTCAQRAGFTFRMIQDNAVTDFISYCRTHTLEKLPPNTEVANKYVRFTPIKTPTRLEKYFASYTYKKKRELVEEYGSDVVETIFDYWKLKRFDKGGPLTLPSYIYASVNPIFTEFANKPNEIPLRKEPKNTRMAADNMRTLLWMVTDREFRKQETCHETQAPVNKIGSGVVSEGLDDEQISQTVNLINDLNFGLSNNTTILRPDDDDVVVKCSAPDEEKKANFSIDNYIPNPEEKLIEPVVSYCPPVKDNVYWNQFEGLDYDSADEKSPFEESFQESDDDEDESKDASAIFLGKPGQNFDGECRKIPTPTMDQKNVLTEEIIALLYD